MVSSFVLRTEIDHDGVMRRSEAREPSVLVVATETMTETSVGVCWKDIFAAAADVVIIFICCR